MFECPNCKQTCKRLISSPSMKGLYCELCYDRPKSSYANLHLRPSWATEKGLTYAKSNIISRRIISPDDHKTVIDRTTGKPTEL